MVGLIDKNHYALKIHSFMIRMPACSADRKFDKINNRMVGRQKSEDGREKIFCSSFSTSVSCLRSSVKKIEFIETKVTAMKLQGFKL